MAKRRLNKKVAFIGSAVFIFLTLAVIAIVLYLSRDADKFIADGDAAFAAKDYIVAEQNYNKARGLAKSDSLRVELLFKLVDMYIEQDEWPKVLGCWNRIVQVEPENFQARFKRLCYFYVVADSGAGMLWQEVQSQASEFIDLAQEQGLAEQDTAVWQSEWMQQIPERSKIGMEKLDAYLYMARGRARLEMARLGSVTDIEAMLDEAVGDLEMAREKQPDNPITYQYLASVAISRGELLASKGDIEGKEKAAERAEQYLAEAIESYPENVEAHINLLVMKPLIMSMRDAALTQERIEQLEPEYEQLIGKFDSSAQAYAAMAGFYSMLKSEKLDQAIEKIEKAVTLDPDEISFVITATNLYYRKFSIDGEQPKLNEAIEMAQRALDMEGAKETKGPLKWTNRRNHLRLCEFLAKCYLGQVFDDYIFVYDDKISQAGLAESSKPSREELIAKAEKIIYDIGQIYGSGDMPEVVKWEGLLELAKGNKAAAIRKLYAVYEQFKASQRRDMLLSHTLARLFDRSVEIGAAAEFYASALSISDRSAANKIDSEKPEVLLDYASVLLKLKAYPDVVNIVAFFESEYGANKTSKTVRVRALIRARQFDVAQEELAKLEPDDHNAMVLKLELLLAKMRQLEGAVARERRDEGEDVVSRGFTAERDRTARSPEAESSIQLMSNEVGGYAAQADKLISQLLLQDPNYVADDSIAFICGVYIRQNQLNKAEQIIDSYMKYFPDNASVLFYKKIFAKLPDPEGASWEQRRKIEEEALQELADPTKRAIALGVFYKKRGEPNQALLEFEKVFRLNEGTEDKQLDTTERIVAGHLSEIAMSTENLDLAEKVAALGKQTDLDSCQGEFFGSIVAIIKKEYKEALTKLDYCVKQRPVFSSAYSLRSSVNQVLGNEHAAIMDIQKASSLNPMDGRIAKSLMSLLYQRNLKQGNNVTQQQLIEVRTALDKAMVLNPQDWKLQSFYAEYINETEPYRALAIRQNLQKVLPSVENALLLGRMAMRTAEKQSDTARREALFSLAQSSFEQARSYEPENAAVLESFAEYYRLIDQPEKAEELLTQSQDKRLLWRHYLRSGKVEQAKNILEQLYASDAKNTDTLRGLLTVAERNADKDAANKYSEDLLSIEDSQTNRLIQIEIFLKTGLIQQAEDKLMSFSEKYPGDGRAFQLKGWLAMRRGQLEKALKFTSRALELRQDNAVAWRLRGQINHLMANYDQAILDFKKSKAIADDPMLRYLLAKAYVQVERYEDAITELEVVMDDPIASAESILFLERIYRQLKRIPALERFYAKLLKKYPDNYMWYMQAAEFEMMMGRMEESQRLYKIGWEKNLASQQVDGAVFDNYLYALVEGEKYGELLQECRKYVDGEFAPIAYYRMAQVKLKLGDRKTAIEYCRKAFDKAALSEGLAEWILQNIHRLLGAEEVEKICQEKIRVAPDSLAPNFGLYNLARLDGRYNKAIEYIDKCIKIVGPDSPKSIGFVTNKVSVLLAAHAKTSDNVYLLGAIKEYESLLTKMPNNSSVLNNLAFLLAESDLRIDDALTYAEKAYQAEQDDPSYSDTYGFVLYKYGKRLETEGNVSDAKQKYSKALELLQASVQQYESKETPVPAEVYEHLGMLQEVMDEKYQAINSYNQALQSGKESMSEMVKKRLEQAVERLSD